MCLELPQLKTKFLTRQAQQEVELVRFKGLTMNTNKKIPRQLKRKIPKHYITQTSPLSKKIDTRYSMRKANSIRNCSEKDLRVRKG